MKSLSVGLQMKALQEDFPDKMIVLKTILNLRALKLKHVNKHSQPTRVQNPVPDGFVVPLCSVHEDVHPARRSV